jgi:hypothetical protein
VAGGCKGHRLRVQLAESNNFKNQVKVEREGIGPKKACVEFPNTETIDREKLHAWNEQSLGQGGKPIVIKFSGPDSSRWKVEVRKNRRKGADFFDPNGILCLMFKANLQKKIHLDTLTTKKFRFIPG